MAKPSTVAMLLAEGDVDAGLAACEPAPTTHERGTPCQT
jgi:hypothetical protein